MFESAVDQAVAMSEASNGIQQVKLSLGRQEFACNALLRFVLCNTIFPYTDHVAPDLEADLEHLVHAIGLERVRSAFADQLVVALQDAFEDVRYEIAASRVCSAFFDDSTLELEKLIAGTQNNSDIFGRVGEVRYRFEVTVVHDDWLRGLDVSVSAEIEAADIPTGYVVVLGGMIESVSQASRVRELIEAIFRASQVTPESDIRIGDMEFLWSSNEYRTRGPGHSIQRLSFEADPSVRIVATPAVSRNVIDRNDAVSRNPDSPDDVTAWVDPRGVISGLSVQQDRATHEEIPLSTTIRRTAERKLKQCEPGCVNVLVLGQPLAMNDSSVQDAFFGATYLVGHLDRDSSDVGTLGDLSLRRRTSKPFVRAAESEYRELFVEHFRVMSAVIMVRLDGPDPRFELLSNPNANEPLSDEQWCKLEAIGRARFRVAD